MPKSSYINRFEKITKRLIGGKLVNKKIPKRRKLKDNPYTLSFGADTYYVSFKDKAGIEHCVAVSEEVFDVFNQFELEDKSYLNEWDRHIEQSELTEKKLNERSAGDYELLDDYIIRVNETERLHYAISQLPKVQARRIKLYYFNDMTFKEIGELEGCNYQAIQSSIYCALERLKKVLKNL